MHSKNQDLYTETSAENNNLKNEILFDNISEEFSSKRDLGIPVSKKLTKIVNSFFNIGLEEEKLKNFNRINKRPEQCPHLGTTKVNSESWNENLLTANRMTNINLREIQLLNVSTAYAITETCEKVIGWLAK